MRSPIFPNHARWLAFTLAIVFWFSTRARAENAVSANAPSANTNVEIDFRALATMPDVAQGIAANYRPANPEELAALEKQAEQGVLRLRLNWAFVMPQELASLRIK